jgi:hypothetical protein
MEEKNPLFDSFLFSDILELLLQDLLDFQTSLFSFNTPGKKLVHRKNFHLISK